MKYLSKKFLICILPFLTFNYSFDASATTQDGLSIELGTGYSQLSLTDQAQNAKYSGLAAQGRILFPMLSSGLFSTDFDLSYQYYSLENNSSSNVLSEWSHLNAVGTGLRFNYSFLFVGVDYLFLNGKHVRSGTSNQIFDYDVNPIRWEAGLALPVSPVTSVVFSYSQIMDEDFDANNSNLTMNNQVFWIKFQIDFGVSFFNLLKPKESFKSTRDSFILQGRKSFSGR